MNRILDSILTQAGAAMRMLPLILALTGSAAHGYAPWTYSAWTDPGTPRVYQYTTLYGDAEDPDSDLNFIEFQVYTPTYGWGYAGTYYVNSSEWGTVHGYQGWSAGETGWHTLHIRAQDFASEWDANGDVFTNFYVDRGQQSVSSQNKTLLRGQAFTPDYFGGAGSGSWQFVVSYYTNWGGTAPGTLLWPSNAASTSWTPPSTGTYEFYVRRLEDGNWEESNIAGPYYLTVYPNPPSTSLSVSATSIPRGWVITANSYTTDPNGLLTEHAIDYFRPGAPDWVNGIRWDGGPAGSNTLAPQWYLDTPGTWYLRSRGRNSDGAYSDLQYQTVSVGGPDQAAISSQNKIISLGQNFTPDYSGGSGSGAWQFHLPYITGWGTFNPGTLLGGTTPSTYWTPSSNGNYTFYIRRMSDGTYNETSPAGPYTLTVVSPPYSGISADRPIIFVGESVVLTGTASGGGNMRRFNIDQLSPNSGYYGNVSTGTQTPSGGAYYDVSNGSSASRQLTLTISVAGTYTFRGAVEDGITWHYGPGTAQVRVLDPNADADGDGIPNIVEYQTGTIDTVGVADTGNTIDLQIRKP